MVHTASVRAKIKPAEHPFSRLSVLTLCRGEGPWRHKHTQMKGALRQIHQMQGIIFTLIDKSVEYLSHIHIYH